MNARSPGVQPDRVRISDEVDIMPAVGKFQAKFRCDNPAAAIRRITSDADLHLGRVAISIRFSYLLATYELEASTWVRSFLNDLQASFAGVNKPDPVLIIRSKFRTAVFLVVDAFECQYISGERRREHW